MDSAQLAVAVVGVAGVLIGLWYAGVQLRDSRMSARGTFLLELDSAFVRHDATHRRLRGGDWAKPRSGPKNRKEWADVEAYMGLFERIEVLIDGGVIDTSVVDRLYGYRVSNIVANGQIRQKKLVDNADGWRDFFKLMKRLKRYRKFHGFTLELDNAMIRHDATDQRLQPRGDWAGTGNGPESDDEWRKVEAYKGLFERIEILIENDVVDTSLVNDLYGDRVQNIVANEQIRQKKLIDHAAGWSEFCQLVARLKRLGREFPEAC